MINGFDEQTSPLNGYEHNVLLPVIIGLIGTKVGKRNAITNKEICAIMSECGYKVNEPRIRKMINHIRTNDYVRCLTASAVSYLAATEKEELEEYIQSLENRESAIRAVRKSMERQMACVFNSSIQYELEFKD